MTDQIKLKLKETPGPIFEMKGRDGEVERVQFVIVEEATDGDKGEPD